MPEMDGTEATTLIRSQSDNLNQNTPIIALTAAALLEERKRVFQAGMNDFVTKPFSPKTLQNLILKWLQHTRSLALQNTQNTIQINFKYLEEISAGDIDFIGEMVETFIANTPKDVELLSTYLEDKDASQVQKTAHRLKTNFMMMGMDNQQQIAKNIETMAANANKIPFNQLGILIKQLTQDANASYPLLAQKMNEFRDSKLEEINKK